MRIAVIVATKGRASAVKRLLGLLEEQTRAPFVVVISATEDADIPVFKSTSLTVEYILGPAGLCGQRNRALEKTRDRSDIVIFFDDDFAPSPTWLENCENAFMSDGGIVGMSGGVLRDGALKDEVSWAEAELLIHGPAPVRSAAPKVTDCTGLYGCNMAYRASAIGLLTFDERLVLYGWLEDLDFSRSAGRRGRLVMCDAMVGVHLGIKSGRVSGKKYGYSQVVNSLVPAEERCAHFKGSLVEHRQGGTGKRSEIILVREIYRSAGAVQRESDWTGQLDAWPRSPREGAGSVVLGCRTRRHWTAAKGFAAGATVRHSFWKRALLRTNRPLRLLARWLAAGGRAAG